MYNTGLFEMIVGVLTTCHAQYTWDRSICIFLFNRTTIQGFVTYLTGALYVHPLWFYTCVWQAVKTPTVISNNLYNGKFSLSAEVLPTVTGGQFTRVSNRFYHTK